MKLPQLSLRDLFWLVALVAMGCGWWVDHRKQMADKRALFDAVYEAGFGFFEEEGRLTMGQTSITEMPEQVDEGRRQKWLSSQP